MSLIVKISNYNNAKTAHKSALQALNDALDQIGSSKKLGKHAYHAFHVHYMAAKIQPRAFSNVHEHRLSRKQNDDWLYKRDELIMNEMHYRAYKKKMYDVMLCDVVNVIKRAWFRAITNPEYAICKKRLMTEFNEM